MFQGCGPHGVDCWWALTLWHCGDVTTAAAAWEGDLDIQGQEGRLGSKIFAVLGLGPAVTGMMNLKLRLGILLQLEFGGRCSVIS